ncbi:hypothetical protein B1H58_02290 [Pantoea alhagi]|uniref:Uncharacterized protein n=1 Tax=Pantoea alhagi TaxID=1891675 RepID=A0A1W6B1H4_9GAMM|nr:hypothetical protein [Pantoea alhagi]ARJ40939.1 hypothetical protein B1H58_02290 [Pantoea alhagi]
MAIDMTCFTTLPTLELQCKLNFFQEKNPEIFPVHYLLYKACPLDRFDKDISMEYGLNAESSFMIAVNNKALDISTDEMANMIRNELGKENVIVLLNGEDLI